LGVVVDTVMVLFVVAVDTAMVLFVVAGLVVVIDIVMVLFLVAGYTVMCEATLLNGVLCVFTTIKIYFNIKLCDIHIYTVDRSNTSMCSTVRCLTPLSTIFQLYGGGQFNGLHPHLLTRGGARVLSVIRSEPLR
jgi:predicted ferric reductase